MDISFSKVLLRGPLPPRKHRVRTVSKHWTQLWKKVSIRTHPVRSKASRDRRHDERHCSCRHGSGSRCLGQIMLVGDLNSQLSCKPLTWNPFVVDMIVHVSDGRSSDPSQLSARRTLRRVLLDVSVPVNLSDWKHSFLIPCPLWKLRD
jgi:hypothetical protein